MPIKLLMPRLLPIAGLACLLAAWSVTLPAQDGQVEDGQAQTETVEPVDGGGTETALDALAPSEFEDANAGASLDLDDVTRQMRLTEDRIANIRAEILALDGDATELGLQLRAADERVDMADGDIRLIEDRIEELLASEESVRLRLDGHDRSISNLLASLQRITVSPPPALIVDPSDALGSARAALLLGAVLPQLQERAADVTADLERLGGLKSEVLAEADRLNANLLTLNEERLRIATVIEARTQGLEWLSEDLIREEAEAQALADRARSLEQLIEGLERRIAAVTTARDANRAASAGEDVPALDPEVIAVAFADDTRTEPAVPLESARGYLTSPVTGDLLISFGAADGFGGTSKGLSIETEAGAQVVAPADGWVVYTGPFLNYGEIAILNAGQDYMIVLAGLARTDVERGAFVRMGEPVGTMGSQPDARIAARSEASGPALYVELREGGIPIDPQGWWTALTVAQESGAS
ncbi:murein hydrolase activator EnvC family protein [Pelagibacterium montanilacus]|uniref:murein hydrolase activator EnvC family protein n=1 Tax=Pelagibacterium montanilacus TaxID=2185280 RepID=UPI000F8EECA2|nr:peptidoglycan DD-metalloendopeptidase family protein [Pelagibacterium montanilacus]